MQRLIGFKVAAVLILLTGLILTPVFGQAAEKGNKKDIIDTCPNPNQEVCSPIAVTGKAKGPWFFEGSFPIRLVDAQGKELAASSAKAIGDWTTPDFVKFEGNLEYEVTKATKATIILQNANPSGDPKTAKRKEIPVMLIPKKK
jgi:hypothetical protein